MSTPSTETPTIYYVATTTPPEIICPSWCRWTAEEHLDELNQMDGEVTHSSEPYNYAAAWKSSYVEHFPVLTVIIGQTTMVDGQPSLTDEMNHGSVVINIEGHEFSLDTVERLANDLLAIVREVRA